MGKDISTLKGIYAIIGPSHITGNDYHHTVKIMLNNGIRLFQWRDKTSSTRDMIEICRDLCHDITSHHGVLLVNDRVDVALASKAHGVHLGQQDMSIKDARKILGNDKIIGISATQQQHIDAIDTHICDYISLGAIFPTNSKADAKSPIGVNMLKKYCDDIKNIHPTYPIFCISGVHHDNMGDCFAAGVDGVAMAQALCVGDVAKNCQQAIKIYHQYKM